ncbi:MAG: hypothetical protein M3Q58_16025 [Bacteroidota bacterium]|nr:hypothetical protein [Bacteroidota bacterium]
MEELAGKIYEIIKDYQCDYPNRKFEISVAHIIEWANQFDEDAEFVLSELLHILPEIYISKEKAKFLLKQRLLEYQEFYKYNSMEEFIAKTIFIDVQKEEKSQKEILFLIDEILKTDFKIDSQQYTLELKKHFIYFDDILATGGNIFRDLSYWFNEEEKGIKNIDKVLKKEITISISLFCSHQLGYGNVIYQFMKTFDDKLQKLILLGYDYKIENQVKWEKQRLNCTYPIKNQPKEVAEYLSSLNAENISVPAFRPDRLPITETFFSNSSNRIKFENILVEKGLTLINKIKSESPDPRKRPLGDTVKSHGTLGTGTLFFTWRNISNTCPLVFWWDVAGHNWIPLFFVKNRGSN